MNDCLFVSTIAKLPPTRLLSLGRINVICGKNSSGKSTLLLGLINGAYPGLDFQRDEARRALIDMVAAHIDQGSHPRVHAAVSQTVQTIVEDHDAPRWFASDGGKFCERFESARLQDPTIGGLHWNRAGIATAFADLFPGRQAFVLIPAKRRLDVTVTIDTNASVGPDGAGLLNRLAFLRNQLPGSPELVLYNAISDAFHSISDGFSFTLIHGYNNLLSLSFTRGDGMEWGTADAFGLGLQDLLVLIYFAHAPDIQCIAIEEPETHMHPDMQRRLLAHLAKRTTKQYFFATHSNVFLSGAFTERVLLTRFDKVIRVEDVTSRAEVLMEMGFSVADNVSPDLVILVEGPNDVAAFTEFLGKWDLADTFDIRLWPLGGDNMRRVDLHAFEGQTLLAIVDADPESASVREEFRRRCHDAGVPLFVLERYSLENYFSLAAYRDVFPDQSHLLEFTDVDFDPAVKMATQLRFNPKKKDNIRRLARVTSKDFLLQSDIGHIMDEVRRMAVTRSLNRHILAQSLNT